MYNFCTLFDSYYLAKGLILYRSLCNVCDDFCLYVFAFDDKCYAKLAALDLPKMKVISLKELENEKLLEVKEKRTRAEYCWTCGPSAIWYAIQRFNLESCAYLDADLLFFHSPELLYREINQNKASIAITEHFTEEENIGGRFCVQFVYFKNNNDGLSALEWWRDRCIEWCYAHYEDGKYGDQKYLDCFPSKFNNVHIIENRGVGVAPWNMYQYQYLKDFNLIYKGKTYPIIFFHYHGIRINVEKNKIILKAVTYDISTSLKKLFFEPFLILYESVCECYLDVQITGFHVEKRMLHERLFSLVKKKLKGLKVIRKLYYAFNSQRYNGYETSPL